MNKKKSFRLLIALALCVMLVCSFSVTAFAYADDTEQNLPITEATQPEDTPETTPEPDTTPETIVPGEPLEDEGNVSATFAVTPLAEKYATNFLLIIKPSNFCRQANSLYTVSGRYHTATASFQINITPPIRPLRTMFSATTPTVPEIPKPIGIRVNILPIPKGTPQASQTRKKSIEPFFVNIRLKIENSSSAATIGNMVFFKNSFMTSFFVIAFSLFQKVAPMVNPAKVISGLCQMCHLQGD